MRRRAFTPGLSLQRVICAAFALLLAGSGCKPADPLSAVIAADDSTTFVRWKRDTASNLPPDQQKQLETTIEEIRLDVMLRQEASGRDPIQAAVCARLNHLTVKQALLLGGNLRWQRLAAERDDLQRVANANAHLITKPGDQAAASDLEQYRAKFQKRIDELSSQLQAVEQDLVALGAKVPTLNLPASTTKPVAVSREEAQKQIADMLDGRRGSATLRFGAWPVKVDWEGRQLTGDKQEEFLAKKSVNGRGERVVIPIRIKGRWLLFEAADQAPTLPEDVRAQLKPDELAAFHKNWLEVEAEIWARQVSASIPDPVEQTEDEAPSEQPKLIHK